MHSNCRFIFSIFIPDIHSLFYIKSNLHSLLLTLCLINGMFVFNTLHYMESRCGKRQFPVVLLRYKGSQSVFKRFFGIKIWCNTNRLRLFLHMVTQYTNLFLSLTCWWTSKHLIMFELKTLQAVEKLKTSFSYSTALPPHQPFCNTTYTSSKRFCVVNEVVTKSYPCTGTF